MTLNDSPAPAADVVAREVAGETVLLNLASGTYFGLNEVGGLVWQWLQDDAGCTLREISERIEARFAVTLEQAEDDVLNLARQLADNGLIDLAAA